jgi:preprotein translocase subunit SecA
MKWAGMDEETAIENSLVNKSIENAQVRVEGYNFDIRKHLVDYDDVISKQREVIYAERAKLIGGCDLKTNILDMLKSELKELVESNTDERNGEEPDFESLRTAITTIMPLPPEMTTEALSQMKPKQIIEELDKYTETLYEAHEKQFGAENMRIMERLIMLRTIDSLWIEHLTAMEEMRQGIGIEAAGQDPLVLYKTKGHEMFQELMKGIQETVAHTIFHVSIKRENAPARAPAPSPMAKVQTNRAEAPVQPPARVVGKKVGRNDQCPCGSGKKYKHCCGR